MSHFMIINQQQWQYYFKGIMQRVQVELKDKYSNMHTLSLKIESQEVSSHRSCIGLY